MSQRDLATELRAARSVAPTEVRERVRAIAAMDTTARASRFTWRRALVLAVPVAAAVAATIVFTRPAHQGSPVAERLKLARPAAVHGAAAQSYGAVTTQSSGSAAQSGAAKAAPGITIPVSPSHTRVQRYGAALTLRVPTPDGVSTGVQRALRIAAALGGHPTSVHATSQGRTAHAELVLRIPRHNVQRAVTSLSQLGTITGEQVDVQDLQAGLDASSRTIGRLQRKLADLRAQTQTPEVVRQIAALTTRIASLQRAQANTVRTASFATVRLTLATPPMKVAPSHTQHSPFHWLWRALLWLGIGTVYVLVLAIPLVLVGLLVALIVRAVRRRREDALLSRT